MLTILYPGLVPHIVDFPLGLSVVKIRGEARTILIVKMIKEGLLAAKLNRGFKIYVVPIDINGMKTVSIISAFFDDADEPLVLYTPMFDTEDSHALRDAMLEGELNVHLFDDNGRELLGYMSAIHVPPVTKDRLEHAPLLPFSYPSARIALDSMPDWFGIRNEKDDVAAITVQFVDALFSEEIVILDARPESYAHHVSQGVTHTILERQEPGAFQELDIVLLLGRIFPMDQIYLNPLRITDREEIADVIVITKKRILLIQAKDSPNTEQGLAKSMDRKKSASLKSMKKAIAQVRGAVSYCQSIAPMTMLVNDEKVVVSIENLEMASLIILKEMFLDQYAEYSPPILELTKKNKVPCIALDYGELIMYTSHLQCEESFFQAYNRVFESGLQRGEFIRLRLGVSGE